jgi:hypothetical protein
MRGDQLFEIGAAAAPAMDSRFFGKNKNLSHISAVGAKKFK